MNRSLLNLSTSLFSLTASRDREQSFESQQWGGGHGIFTYYVVKGLEGEADTNGDGIVTADELAEYVHDQCARSHQRRAESHLRARQLRSQHGARLQSHARDRGHLAAARSSARWSSRPTWMESRSSSTAAALAL